MQSPRQPLFGALVMAIRWRSVVYLWLMKSLRYIPLAYFAGLHGFAIFAPYAALVLLAFHIVRRSRS
jgi:hypothetical protein